MDVKIIKVYMVAFFIKYSKLCTIVLAFTWKKSIETFQINIITKTNKHYNKLIKFGYMVAFFRLKNMLREN